MLLCLVAALGAAIGDNIAYSIGHGVGSTRFRWMRTPRSAATIGRARHALDRRPAPLLLAGRFIPVGRVVINMTAGALRFPRRRFIPLCLVSALSWAVFSAVIGIFAGRWRSGSPLLSALLGTLLALGIGLLIERIHSLRGRSSGATAG
ncbi:DedA family protein [Schumannella luteola]|nr:DedA family protein [Schumannella luteola]